MDSTEIKDIAESLRRRVEFLIDAGITDLPGARALKSKGTAIDANSADWVVFKGALKDATAFSPCAHQDWKGVLFGIWPLGRAAVLWGVPVAGQTFAGGPFGAEPLSQLDKMLAWLAGELKSSAAVAPGPDIVIAARCPQDGIYSDTDAATACLGALEPYLKGAAGVLLMGELAAWAFLQSADLDGARAKVHRGAGRSIVATYPPDEWGDQASKKAVHIDLKLLIKALEG